MGDDISNRAERREEIKLKLELLKVIASLGVIATLVFAGLQWGIANQTAKFANQIANENAYYQMTNLWRDHIKTFVDKPHLRPYFEEMKELSIDDQNKDAALALADMRLSAMDDLLTYARQRDAKAQIVGWENTFANAFRTSPILCIRFKQTATNYGLIVPIANSACTSILKARSN